MTRSLKIHRAAWASPGWEGGSHYDPDWRYLGRYRQPLEAMSRNDLPTFFSLPWIPPKSVFMEVAFLLFLLSRRGPSLG